MARNWRGTASDRPRRSSARRLVVVDDPLLPIYDLPPGGVIELYNDEGVLSGQHGPGRGTFRLWFEWSAGLRFHGSGEGLWSEDDEPILTLPSKGPLSVSIIESRTTIPAGTWEASGHINHAVMGDLTAALDRVDFQVANFRPFIRADNDPPPEARGRLTLRNDEWSIRLDQLRDARQRLRELNLNGRGAVMHAGRLTRVDGRAFAWSAGSEALESLSYLLTFGAGDRSPLLLPVGIDTNGSVAVEEWGTPKRADYKGRLNWCSPWHVGALTQVWARFFALWSDEQTQMLLRVALELYAEANQGNLETRLIKVQAGLEALSWHWLTREAGMDSDYVDDHSAAWRLRKMLGVIGAPLTVPDPLTAAIATWPDRDGPDTVTHVRNTITHPKGTSELLHTPNEAKHDVLRLATWYFDLALLRLLNFYGQYLNRTRALPYHESETETPPWS